MTLGERVDKVLEVMHKEEVESTRYAAQFPAGAEKEADFQQRNAANRAEFIRKVEALIEEYQL